MQPQRRDSKVVYENAWISVTEDAVAYPDGASGVYGVVHGLTSGEPDREPTEQDMVHRRFTDTEVEDLIRSGALADSASLAALLLYRMLA